MILNKNRKKKENKKKTVNAFCQKFYYLLSKIVRIASVKTEYTAEVGEAPLQWFSSQQHNFAL